MLTFYTIIKPEERWSDLTDKEVIYFGDEASPIEIVAIPKGMASGGTSIKIRLDLPDGRVVIIETALYELANAVRSHPSKIWGIALVLRKLFLEFFLYLHYHYNHRVEKRKKKKESFDLTHNTHHTPSPKG